MPNKKNVIKLQCPFERIKKYEPIGEKSLYRAVILQMIIDASNLSEERRAKRLENEAKNWLFGENAEFIEICKRAELMPRHVRKLAQNLIELHHAQNLNKR